MHFYIYLRSDTSGYNLLNLGTVPGGTDGDFKIRRAAMVAKVPCNLTPRHPPSQVLDNLPRYGG